MAIEKLPEFAKNGQKNTDKLNQEDGFPINLKPARQWFNFLFNKLSSTINQLIDDKLEKTENAVSASKLQTQRTVQFSGAATGSFSYDGSTNSSTILTLANSGVTAGTYGNNLTIPILTVNNKGLITVAATQVIRAATTAQNGVVQLNSTLTSASITQALTAAMGKKLQDDKLGKTENAASASVLQTQRTVQFSGAATGSFTYNGSANSSAVLTLANSGVTASVYGAALKVPVLTINAKGLIAVATTQDIPVFNGSTSVGLVPARVGSTTNRFLNEAGQWVVTPNTTYSVITAAEMQVGTATAARTVSAKLLKEAVLFWAPTPTNITGNAGSATKLDPGRKINGVHFDGTKDISCGFGVGQKWYNELSRRTFNTIYRNTSANPIFVDYLVSTVPSQSNVKLFVNNELYVSSTTLRPAKTIIIGPGDSYELRTYKTGVNGSETPTPATGFVMSFWEEYK